MSTNEVKNLPDPLEETEAGYRDPIRQLPPVSLEMLARRANHFATSAHFGLHEPKAMRRLHAEVRRDVERRELAQHVKLGPGGIREIEFIVQALQLVRAGRDPALIVRPTLQVLGLLAQRNQLPGEASQELAEAYVFLRRTEHALQYLYAGASLVELTT